MAGAPKQAERGKAFSGAAISLDGRSFIKCSFDNCTFTYAGGELPVISDCSFNDCRWQFAGGAANTIAFLSGMYNGGFDKLVEDTFHEVRKGIAVEDGNTASAGTVKPATGIFLKPLRVFKNPRN